MNMTAHRPVSIETVTAGACLGWMVRAAAVGRMESKSLLMALDTIGAPDEVAQRIKAAVGAATTTGQPELAGSSTILTSFLDQLAEQSILARLFSDNAAQRLPLRTRLVGLTGDVSASVVNEGRPIPAGAFDFSGQVVQPFKVAAMTILSNELWRNTSQAGQAYVNMRLRNAVARAADAELFTRLTDSGTLETSADETDAAAIVGGLRDLLNSVHTRAGSRLHWAVTPSAANVLATTNGRDDLDAFGGQVLNLPATITTGLPGKRVALIDGRAVGGLVESARIEASGQGAIEMLDNPTNNPVTPTATTLVSLFQANSTAVRIVMTLAAESIRANPLAILELV